MFADRILAMWDLTGTPTPRATLAAFLPNLLAMFIDVERQITGVRVDDRLFRLTNADGESVDLPYRFFRPLLNQLYGFAARATREQLDPYGFSARVTLLESTARTIVVQFETNNKARDYWFRLTRYDTTSPLAPAVHSPRLQ
jgi:hypothetical protein